jgi:hypothetical protein
MIMRYYGGGIGHRNNSPPEQAHESYPLNPNSDEMAMEEEEDGDTGTNARYGLQDILMNDIELEAGENDEEDRSGDGDNYDYDKIDEGSDKDEDREYTSDSDNDEEGGYGYASP